MEHILESVKGKEKKFGLLINRLNGYFQNKYAVNCKIFYKN
jgi:hypothetical protein